jgi:hypothetical protein
VFLLAVFFRSFLMASKPSSVMGVCQVLSEQEFRQQCLQNFTKHKALDFMFQTIKEICAEANKIKDEKC